MGPGGGGCRGGALRRAAFAGGSFGLHLLAHGRYGRIDLGQAHLLGDAFIALGDALVQGIEPVLHGADALEQRRIHQCGDRLAVLGDDDAVAAVLHTVKHVAQVLAQGDGGGFGDHGWLP